MLFIFLAVWAGLDGWRSLYAPTPQDTGALTDLASINAGLAVNGSLILTAAAGILVFHRGRSLTLSPGRRGSRLHAFAAALLLLPTMSALGGLGWYYLGRLWPALAAPSAGSPAQITDTWSAKAFYVSVATSVIAGLVEELCALAVPIWIAERVISTCNASPRSRRIVLATLGVVLVAVRIAYHLYQGPPAFGHLLWAVATVALYLRTRQLAPIIVAHIFTDLVGFFSTPLSLDSAWLWVAIQLAPTLLAGAGLLALDRRRRLARIDTFTVTVARAGM